MYKVSVTVWRCTPGPWTAFLSCIKEVPPSQGNRLKTFRGQTDLALDKTLCDLEVNVLLLLSLATQSAPMSKESTRLSLCELNKNVCIKHLAQGLVHCSQCIKHKSILSFSWQKSSWEVVVALETWVSLHRSGTLKDWACLWLFLCVRGLRVLISLKTLFFYWLNLLISWRSIRRSTIFQVMNSESSVSQWPHGSRRFAQSVPRCK